MFPRFCIQFCCVLMVFLLPNEGAAQKIFHGSKTINIQLLSPRDDVFLNYLSHARYMLLSGRQGESVHYIRLALDAVGQGRIERSYRTVEMVLIRENGKNNTATFMYVPVTYAGYIGDENSNLYLEQVSSWLDTAQRDPVITALEIDYREASEVLNEALILAQGRRLKRADRLLQNFTKDIVDDPYLKDDLILTVSHYLDNATDFLKRGRVRKAQKIIKGSEKFLKLYIDENPGTLQVQKLQSAMKSYDKIRTFNPQEKSSDRNKIFNHVNDLNRKLQVIKTSLP